MLVQRKPEFSLLKYQGLEEFVTYWFGLRFYYMLPTTKNEKMEATGGTF